jgi:N-glycosylase/DNA lyase
LIDRFLDVAPQLGGTRLLLTEPRECVFSFICSQNNNEQRIGQLVTKLARHYGSLIWDGNGDGGVVDDALRLHSFPSVERLSRVDEDELRGLGFGYRAKYVRGAAKQLLGMAAEFDASDDDRVRLAEHCKLYADANGAGAADAMLLSMRAPHSTLRDATGKLVKLLGIGAKVADCIALMGLNHRGAVPVDVHVRRVVERYTDTSIATKTLTSASYNALADAFRAEFPAGQSGAAQLVIFAAELRRLPPTIIDDE